MHIRIGHTPDADDAFMFYGIQLDRVERGNLSLEHCLAPMQQLNRWAREQRFEMTACSFATYGSIADRYRPMKVGISFGHDYGPMIVSRSGLGADEVARRPMASPGELTTAHWLARMWNPNQSFVTVPFDQVLTSVLEGRFDSALVIHEGQMTFAEQGLQLVVDLGAWFGQRSGGLPIPLGLNVVSRQLPEAVQRTLTRALYQSIELALQEVEEAVDLALPLARGLDRERCREFILRYVNSSTLDPGSRGLEAVQCFYAMARQAGLVESPPPLDWLSPH